MKSKALLWVSACLVAGVVFGTPTNTPELDGRMGDYDDFDRKGSYTGGGGGFGAGNYLNDVYVTWDETYLYVALTGAEVDNKLAVLIDVDPGNGTGATSTTNWTGNAASFISYNDVGWVALTNGFGLDFMVASEGFFNNVVQVLYDGVAAPDTTNVVALYDHGNGASPVGSAVDMAVYGDATTCALNGYEARIPWSVLYGSNTGRYGTVNGGEVVPAGAVIRLFANLHNNNPGIAYSSNDAIPEQVGGSWVDGLLTSDNYLEVPVDLDADGYPDLEPGDVNAPWIRSSAGLAGATNVYVQFNEPLKADTAVLLNAWQVGGSSPASVTMITTNSVLLTLTNALPAAGTLVELLTADIEDIAGNARNNTACLVPVASGLTNILTVRFYLETASGLGVTPGASNFFINGGSAPLQFGLPPALSAPLALDSGTVYYRDVVFPPGTPTTLSYKYSGQLTTTGTNTYEAVRLINYNSAARVLTLDPGLTSMVVTDYLGAAAEPLRDPGNPADYNTLYAESERGDAGIRQRTTVTFALDLRNRDLDNVARVIVQGSDPLRGFNVSASGLSDYAGLPAIGWDNGGVQLFDDGSNGDTNMNDGIFMRTWALSVDGTDAELVPDPPQSLVGGDLSTSPYFGSSWYDRRSPRSFKYKFYVVRNDLTALESPASDIEVYIEDSAGTNVALSPFVWANEDLPPPPPSNSPTMGRPVVLTNNQVRVVFSNLPSEVSGHGVLIATNLLNPGWMDYGLRASGSSGNWTVLVSNANAGQEMYAAYAGPAQTGYGVWFSPNPLPATGGTLRVWYRQHSRNLTGSRVIGLTGPWNGWGNGQPMTFAGNGSWYYDLAVGLADSTAVVFKARTTTGDWDGGPDVYAYKGIGRMTWSPDSPTNGQLLTINYNANGGPLSAATNVDARIGFDEAWFDVGERRMTNILGETNLWEITFEVPTNRSLSVNAVFRNGSTWDSEGNSANGGRQYRIFITPRPYGVGP